MAEMENGDAAVTRSVVAPGWLLASFKLIAGTSIFAMMVAIFLDVVMRYFFNSPLRGVYEITGLLLGIVTMSALPLVTEERSHITVDLIDGILHGAARFIMQLLILIFQCVMIGFLSWRIYLMALREWNSGWVTVDLQISRAPILFGLAALAGLAAVILGVMIIQFLRGRLPVIPVGGSHSNTDSLT